MPAFDPVRDAVLNSPAAETPRLDLSASTFPHPSLVSSSAEPSVPAQSPITRRATHLSVLLNDDPPPEPVSQSLFTPTTTTPTTRGPTSFSHLLHPDEPSPSINEQLAHAAPLRRRSSVVDRSPGRDSAGGYFPPPARSPLAFPGTNGLEPLPSASFSGGERVSVSRPSTGGASPAEYDDIPNRSDLRRRRSSGASDFFRESNFTPPTSSPLALPGNQRTAPGSPVGSPSRQAASLPTSAPRPASPPAPKSRPGTSGSAASASRPDSPRTVRRDSRDMPPPAVPSSSSPSKSEEPPAPKVLSSARSSVPYAPRNRITPPASVLLPLTPAEIEQYKNYPGGIASQLLKRKRQEIEGDGADGPAERNLKRTRDVGLIAEHYNARPEVGLHQRKDSPIIGLKNFNNWVKSVLIISQAHSVVMRSSYYGNLFGSGGGGMRGPARGAGRVLEIGCGKGGDLIKWCKAKIKDFVGIDIATVSVDQARIRYAQLKPPKYTAYFTAADCYTRLLSDILPENVLPPSIAPFDVVSLQFCMHYAFESETKVRTMLTNVSKWMRPGGRFIGTVPNGRWLMEHLDDIPDDAEELSFGNDVFKIRFEEREERPLYGHRYWFFLKDAVEDVPEYVVHWDNFVKLAAEYALDIVYEKEFHEVFSENQEHADFGPMLQHMRVVNSSGESQMDEHQWEAANIYIAFAFEKRGGQPER